MPGVSTVYRWLEEIVAFRDKYARARLDQADTLADEIVRIADETMVGETRTIKPDGTIEIKQGDMLEHRRLRVDARKWIASKLKPKKYGDKTEVEHTGDLKIGVVSYASTHDPA